MKPKASKALPTRKPRQWQGPRREWRSYDATLNDPERAALYVLAAKDVSPEAHAIAKQEVQMAKMIDGNKAVRSFTCHDTQSGAARTYFCAA